MRTQNCPMTVAGAATGDLSASFSTDPMRLENMTWCAIQIVVSGSGSLVGTFKLQASNDLGLDTSAGAAGFTGITNWVDLPSQSYSANADGANMLNVSDAGFRWIRVVWTKTSGTGIAAFRFQGKGL